MRSSAGVGITPPKVLGEPKPSSSVMISSTFGAFAGGTTRGGHQGVDSDAFCLMTPPKGGSGGGSCWPLIVVVALAEPRVPVTCCAAAVVSASAPMAAMHCLERKLPIGCSLTQVAVPGERGTAPIAANSCSPSIGF